MVVGPKGLGDFAAGSSFGGLISFSNILRNAIVAIFVVIW
jgi:hypothetical protein